MSTDVAICHNLSIRRILFKTNIRNKNGLCRPLRIRFNYLCFFEDDYFYSALQNRRRLDKNYLIWLSKKERAVFGLLSTVRI